MTKTPLSGFPCETSRWREGEPAGLRATQGRPISMRVRKFGLQASSRAYPFLRHADNVLAFVDTPLLVCAADMTLRGARARMENFLDIGRTPTVEEQDEQVYPS